MDKVKQLENELHKARQEQAAADKEEFLARVKTYENRAFVGHYPSRSVGTAGVLTGFVKIGKLKEALVPSGEAPQVNGYKTCVYFISQRGKGCFGWASGGCYVKEEQIHITLEPGWEHQLTETLGPEIPVSEFKKIHDDVKNLGVVFGERVMREYGLETLEENAAITLRGGSNHRFQEQSVELDLPHIKLKACESSYLGGDGNPFLHGDYYLLSPNSIALALEKIQKQKESDSRLDGFPGLTSSEYQYLDRKRDSLLDLERRILNT